jgi:hypothetical protein
LSAQDELGVALSPAFEEVFVDGLRCNRLGCDRLRWRGRLGLGSHDDRTGVMLLATSTPRSVARTSFTGGGADVLKLHNRTLILQRLRARWFSESRATPQVSGAAAYLPADQTPQT